MARNIYKKKVLNIIGNNLNSLNSNEKFSFCESWMCIDENKVKNYFIFFNLFIVLVMRWLFTTYNVMSRNVTAKKRLDNG